MVILKLSSYWREAGVFWQLAVVPDWCSLDCMKACRTDCHWIFKAGNYVVNRAQTPDAIFIRIDHYDRCEFVQKHQAIDQISLPKPRWLQA